MKGVGLLAYEAWFVFLVVFMGLVYLTALRPGAGRKAAENALIPFATDDDEASQAPVEVARQEPDHG